MRTLGIAVAVALSCVGTSWAGPLDLGQVAADARWVAHVDVDAFWASTVVQKGYHKCVEMHKHVEEHLNKARDVIGADLRKDLHGITLYGPDTEKEHAVLVVNANVNQKLLLEKAEKAKDHKVTSYGSYQIHGWTAKCPRGTHPAFGAFFKPTVLVFAGCEDRVKAALDVLAGKSASLSGKDSMLARPVRPGTILLARATVINPKTRCPVLKQAESFRLAMGEHKGESFYRAQVNMKDADAAKQIKVIADGFQAMVGLRFGADAEVMKLVKPLNVAVEGKTLNVRWAAPANDVWTVVEKLGKQMAERRAKWEAMRKAASGKGEKAGKCPAAHGDAHKAKPAKAGPAAKKPHHHEDDF